MSNMNDNSNLEGFGHHPIAAPQQLPHIDLASLREKLQGAISNGNADHALVPAEIALPIIERTEIAESITAVYPCWTTLDFTGGHWECVLHGTTFSLDESCKFAGKSVFHQLHETLDRERSEAMTVRVNHRAIQKRLLAVEELVSDWESLHGTDVYMLQKLREALKSEQS